MHKQHHRGHPHGHMTESGLKAVAHKVSGSEDSGTMAEHGLSEGQKVKCPIIEGSQSMVMDHSLQHVRYNEIAADDMNHFSGE